MPPSEQPVVTVFVGADRPSDMDEVEQLARVRYATETELTTALVGADALFYWNFTSPALARVWPVADRLRWIHTASAGVDNVLLPEVAHSEVVVTNSRGVFDRPIAEYVLGLVLMFAKDMTTTLELQRQRTWRHRETELAHQQQVVIVGVGPIGRATAQLLRAAGLRVRGVGRTARDHDPDFGAILPSTQLRAAVHDADYVVAVAPLTSQTRHMFDASVFAAMPWTARFINVGRGGLVVEDELIDALRDGRLGGAALDVFAEEPLPATSPLWTMPGVVISPHMSADTVGWLDSLRDVFVDNFRRWYHGEQLRNVVDKALGYVASARPTDPSERP